MTVQLGQTVRIELRLVGDEGSITGQVPTAAVRRIEDGAYLDFADGAFKTSGWTERRIDLAESSEPDQLGAYFYEWLSGVNEQGEYAIDYEWIEDGVTHQDSEPLRFTDSDLAEKVLNNRMAVNFTTSQLVVYEADGVTPAHAWTLTDKTGGAISDVNVPVGIPKDRT